MNKSLLIPSILVLSLSSASFAQDLTMGMVLEPDGLDPTAGAAAAIDEVVYANIFEGLTRFNSDGSVRNALAQSVEISDDGREYVFMLHEGVKFHDGADFTADDVKFSLDRARAEESINAQKGLFSGIEAVEVIDPLTVKVSLSATDGDFLTKMAWGDAVIVDEASATNNATNPIGTGPFRFVEWKAGERVDLTKNADYWGEPARLDAVSFRFISDANAAFAAMMSEDVDVFANFPAPEMLEQFQADPRFQVLIGSTEGETILAINNRKEKLSDTKAREAICKAVNRQDIIDGAMFGYGTPIGTHFAPHNPAYHADLIELSQFDLESSKALVAELGGIGPLSLKLPPPSYARRGGEIIAANLRAAGIETEISNVEWANWLDEVFKAHDFDLTIVSHTEPMDIGIYANPEYYFGYDSAAVQALMEQLNTTIDPDARTDIMGQVQEIISKDYANCYLFQLAKTGVAKAGLEGLWLNSPTQANDLTAVYWKE